MQKPSNVIDITDRLKNLASTKAVDFVKSGMVVGLGSGSTAEYAIREISNRIVKGKLSSIICIPSSTKTQNFAQELGLNLIGFKDISEIDVTIDGADEVDNQMNLIKGGGGALLREKVLAQNSRRNVIVVHESKLSDMLGTKWAVPVEVLPFALETETRYLEIIGADVSLRILEDGSPFITDQNNFILDSNFGAIKNPKELAGKLEHRAGIIEHGLF
ncbi:MAG: ribose-5-phosphate isomerase RpiA, partial [Candidatus Dadabacteria bacterium]|nr:ribose-5-phosphate isomerase RpiA [Candidatus Dadabacteria bacterium]